MKLTNKEVQEIVARADDEYDRLKDIVHEQYDEIKRLKEEYMILQNASDEVEEEKDKEIERLNKENDDLKSITNIEIAKSEMLEKENKELHSIIKEVREYIMSELITEWDIKNGGHVSGSDLPVEVITPILKILDKENNNE